MAINIHSHPAGDPDPHGVTPGPSESLPPERPHLIEFQIAAGPLGRLVMNRLRAEVFCAGQEFTLPGENYVSVIDHIEFDSPATLGNPPAPAPPTPPGGQLAAGVNLTLQAGSLPFRVTLNTLQLIVPVTLFLKNKSKLLVPKTSKEYSEKRTLQLFFNVTSEEGELCLEYNTVRYMMIALPQIAMAPLDALLKNLNLCSPLKLAALSDVLGDTSISHASVSSDDGFSILSVRMELGSFPGGDAPWLAFVQAPVESFLHHIEWGILLDSRILTSHFEDMVTGATAGMSNLTLEQGPDAVWHSGNVSVMLEDGSKTFPGGVTVTLSGVSWAAYCGIGFSAEASAGLSVPNSNRLEVSVSLEVSPSYWDAFWCAGPIGDIAVLAKVIKINPADVPSACYVRDLPFMKGGLIICDYDINLPSLTFGSTTDFGTLNLDKYFPTTAGPVLGGTLIIKEVGLPSFHVEKTNQFTWGILGSCGNFKIGAEASLHLSGAASINGPAVRLCKPIQILNDELNLFAPRLQLDPLQASWLPLDVRFVFEPNDLPLDSPYWKAPYGPVVLIETSAGSRTIKLDPVPPWTEELIQQLNLRMPQLEANCDAPQTGLFGVAGQFDVHWLVDPGPAEADHLWDGVITGATPGESFILSSPNSTIMESKVDEKGRAELTGVIPASGNLRLTRTAEGERNPTAKSASSPRLRERHAEMIRRREVGVGGSLRFVGADRLDGTPIAILGFDNELRVLDITNPAMPRPVGEAEGARGAVVFGPDLVYWGERGVAFWSRKSEPRDPILACVRVGQHLAALTTTHLFLLDQALILVSRLELPNHGHIAACNRAVVVATSDGLVVVDLSRPTHPEVIGHKHTAPVTAISGGGLPKSGGRVTVHASDKYVTLDASQPRALKTLATHAQPPWSFGTARVGNCWIRPEPENRLIIYTLGRIRGSYTDTGSTLRM